MNNSNLQIVVEVITDAAAAAFSKLNGAMDSMGRAAAGAANAGRNAIDRMTSGMTGSVLAANLLTKALEHALDITKQWTSEAAKYAARTETLAIVTTRLSMANGLSAAAVQANVLAVQKLGITTQESHETVNRMIVAQLDVAKATQLARLAQNAAVVAGVNSSDALQTIIAGIVEQRVQMLRTVGISVSFEAAFKRAEAAMGANRRELTAYEKTQIALNEVLKKTPDIEGAYEAAMGTAGKQMTSLSRFVDEAKNALGERFLPALSQVVNMLTGAAKNVQQHADGYAALAKVIAVAAAAFSAFRLSAWIGAPPWVTAVVVAVTALSAAYVVLKSKTELQREAINQHIGDLKREREELDKAGLSATDYADRLEKLNRQQAHLEIDDARNRAARERDGAGIIETAQVGLIRGGTALFNNLPGAIKPGGFAFRGTNAAARAIAGGLTGAPGLAEQAKQRDAALRADAAADEKLHAMDGRTAGERQRDADKKAADEQERQRIEIGNAKKNAEEMLAIRQESFHALLGVDQAFEATNKYRLEQAVKNIATIHEEADAQKLANEVFLRLGRERLAGEKKINDEEAAEIKRRSTRVDEKTGQIVTFALSPNILSEMHKQTLDKLKAFDIQFALEEEKTITAMWESFGQRAQRLLEEQVLVPGRQALARFKSEAELDDHGVALRASADRARVDQREKYELAALNNVSARTLRAKLAVADQTLRIETDAIKARSLLEIQDIDRRRDKAIDDKRAELYGFGILDTDQPGKAAHDQAYAHIRANADIERNTALGSRDAAVATEQARIISERTKLVTDHYQQIFDSLKQQAGGVFDALLQKSSSVWEAIANSLKTALLTAIKDVVTSEIAGALVTMLTGGRSPRQLGIRQPGILGMVGDGGNGGGGGGGGLFNYFRQGLTGNGGEGGLSIPGAPLPAAGPAPVQITTPPFLQDDSSYVPGFGLGWGFGTHSGGDPGAAAGSAGIPGIPSDGSGVAPGGGAVTGVGGILRGVAGIGGMLGGIFRKPAAAAAAPGVTGEYPPDYKPPNIPEILIPSTGATKSTAAGAILGKLAGIHGGFSGKYGKQLNGAATTFGLMLAVDSLHRNKGVSGSAEAIGGGAMAAYGIAGKQLGVLGAGGVGVLFDGLRRGGAAGVGESALGGAMTGFAIGGPIGAAIGAAVGAGLGVARLFWKTMAEKARAKVKQLYGLDIDDKMTQQIVDIAKQQFHGNLEMALRSKQVLDLLSLYAEATGQSFGLQNQVRPAYLVQSGGGLYQAPSYQNGSSVGMQSSLPSLGGFDKTIGATSYNNGAPMAVTLSLDGQSSARFLQGQTVEAISNNPGAVSAAAGDGYATSAGRAESYTALNAPGTLIR